MANYPKPKNYEGGSDDFTIKRALDGQRVTTPTLEEGDKQPYITYCPQCHSTECSHANERAES